METLSPLDAYRADVARISSAAFGPATHLWLEAGVCLWRIGQLPPEHRADACGRAAAALIRGGASAPAPEQLTIGDADATREGTGTAAGESGLADLATALATVAGSAGQRGSTVDRQASPRAGAVAVTEAVQRLAVDAELAGAFALSFSMLAAARIAFPDLPPEIVGRVLVQQGRIARQAGYHVSASDLYARAEAHGRKCGDAELRVRALIGRGALASVRGNYPEARTLLRRAAAIASREHLVSHLSAAHQGLLNAAIVARDLEAAFRHGWAALQYAGDAPDRRAEVLGSLGGLCLEAGYVVAALCAYEAVLATSTVLRHRLPAWGGAAVAAAHLDRAELLDDITRDALEDIAQSPHAFENAYTLLELAESHARMAAPLDDRQRTARALLMRAVALAEEGSFFEVLHRAQSFADLRASEARPRARTATPGTARPEPSVALSASASESSAVDRVGAPAAGVPIARHGASRTTRHVVRELEALRPPPRRAVVTGAC